MKNENTPAQPEKKAASGVAPHKEPDGDEAMKAKKSDDEDEDPEVKKARDAAALTQERLSKGLENLTSFVNSSAEVKLADLMRKAADGKATAEERAEIVKALSGGNAPSTADKVAEPLKEPMDKSEKANVIDGIERLRASVRDSVSLLAKSQDDQRSAQDSFNVSLAKSVLSIGDAVADLSKSLEASVSRVSGLAAKLDQWASTTPRENFRAVPAGGADQPPAAAQPDAKAMNKSMVEQALSSMLRQSVDAGMKGMSKSGHDLAIAASSVRRHGIDGLPRELKAEVADFVGRKS